MKVLEKKDMACTVGVTPVKVKVEKATLTEKINEAGFPRVKEPVPHLRFGDSTLFLFYKNKVYKNTYT